MFELSVHPLSTSSHLSAGIAEAVKMIDESGLPYLLTPSSTCIEGSWDEVMPVLRACHERLREKYPHVITHIRIDDDSDSSNKLADNIASVESKAGRTLRKFGACGLASR